MAYLNLSSVSLALTSERNNKYSIRKELLTKGLVGAKTSKVKEKKNTSKYII